MSGDPHALVMPLYGDLPEKLPQRLQAFHQAGFMLVLVLNQPKDAGLPVVLRSFLQSRLEPSVLIVPNHNRGGVAGGFNRGIDHARAAGARWITLLDQDSDLPAQQLRRLREPWSKQPQARLVVGPCIWDARRGHWHGQRASSGSLPWHQTRLLISSGTTFCSADWPLLGPMEEWLVVDFVDHAWSFQVQARGFKLLQHDGVILQQQFGSLHPNPICRWLGMELYPPRRHFYGLRNLRFLLYLPEVPWDLKVKEVIKMLIKPWLWLLLEPQRLENIHAILQGMRAPLPARDTDRV